VRINRGAEVKESFEDWGAEAQKGGTTVIGSVGDSRSRSLISCPESA
jgi:hypothetical protein